MQKHLLCAAQEQVIRTNPRHIGGKLPHHSTLEVAVISLKIGDVCIISTVLVFWMNYLSGQLDEEGRISQRFSKSNLAGIETEKCIRDYHLCIN